MLSSEHDLKKLKLYYKTGNKLNRIVKETSYKPIIFRQSRQGEPGFSKRRQWRFELGDCVD